MRIVSCILLSTAALVSGCTSYQTEDTRYRAEEQWRASVTSNVVPLPDATPFDSDKPAREAYLSAYQDGYRSGLTSLNVCYGRPASGYTSYSTERTQGWAAGAHAGLPLCALSRHEAGRDGGGNDGGPGADRDFPESGPVLHHGVRARKEDRGLPPGMARRVSAASAQGPAPRR